MAKFYGNVGYAIPKKVRPGVWEDDIVERPYFGDLIKDTRKLIEGSDLNGNISLTNTISILADAYAMEHYFAIRYVNLTGTLWTVPTVEVERPRLVLRLGEVYNGPTP